MAAEEPLLADQDAGDFARSVPVPKSVVGGVIGRQGAGLENLRQKTGLTVNMTGNKGPNPVLIFSNARSEEDLDAAEALLRKQIESLQTSRGRQESSTDMFEVEPLSWLEQGKKWSWIWGPPYQKEVASLAIKRGAKKKTAITQAAGPAVLFAFKTVALVWGFWLFFAVLSFSLTHCNEEGFASYPLYIYIFFFIMMAVALRWEGKCLSYITIPTCQHLGRPFELMGIRRSYGWWRFMMLGLSCTAHADLATNTLFWAKQIVNDSYCQDGVAFLAVRKQLLQAGARGLDIDYSVLVTIAWLLMGLQAVQGLVLSVPLGVANPETYDVYDWPTRDHYVVGDEYTKDKNGHQIILVVKTLMRKEKDHGGALMSLASAGRMTSVCANSESYLKARYYSWRQSPEGIQLTGTGREQRAASLLSTAFTMWLEKFFFLALLDCMVQLNMQAYNLSVQRALYGSADLQAVFSLFVGIMMSVKTMIEAAAVPRWVFTEAFYQGSTILREARENATVDQPAHGRQVACTLWKLKWLHVPTYVLISFCYVSLFLHGIRTFVMMYICDYSGQSKVLWAAGLGCIDVSHQVQ